MLALIPILLLNALGRYRRGGRRRWRGQVAPARKLRIRDVLAVQGGEGPPTIQIIQLQRLHRVNPFGVPKQVRVGESAAVFPCVRACKGSHFSPVLSQRVTSPLDRATASGRYDAR